MLSPLHTFFPVHAFAPSAQNPSVPGNPSGSHAAEHKYKLPVEIYDSAISG